jgi:hypothetical protein
MSKSSLFDDVARSLASPIPRRRACAQILRGLAVTALASLGSPGVALAAKCGKGEFTCGKNCCANGKQKCLSGGHCCNNGNVCGNNCLGKNQFCCNGKTVCNHGQTCKNGKCVTSSTKSTKDTDGR